MPNNGVVIKITGDASDFEQKLDSIKSIATASANAFSEQFKKAGEDASKAIKNLESVANSGNFEFKIKGSVEQESKRVKNAIDKIGDSAKNSANDVEKSSGRMARGLKTVTSVATSVASGVATVVKWVSAITLGAGIASVKYTSDIEQLQTSFEVMTGSAEKAAEVIDRIRTMGAETPFEMGDLASTVQLLMNYGLTADDAMSKMSMLGDIAQGNAEKMTSIATAYGQMRSAGKVQLEDVKQMIEAGFNPLQIISEKTGESMASLYDRISKGTLAVSEITAAMEAATSAGGRYFQSMQKQSQTLGGMFSTLKDNLQQLGGDLFAPFTDSLRSTILPGAISLIDETGAAFKARGIDGIIAVVNRQYPKLTSAMTKLLKGALDGASQKLPLVAEGLFSALPDLLGSAFELAPDIGDMFFELLAMAVEHTISALPSLTPSLAGGIFDLFGSVFDGVFAIAGGFVSGIENALKQMGVIEWSPEDLIKQSFDNVDREYVKDIVSKINIDPEVTVTEPDVELKSIYDQIAEQLTDGEADTEEVVNGLKTKVEEYYAAQIAKVNEWREAALSGLDSTLPKAEYDAAATEINEQADSIIQNLGTASDAAVAFVESMAGKPTEVVKANLSTLEGYLAEAQKIVEQVGQLTGEAGKTVLEAQREIVSQGLSTDEGVQINAIAYTAQEYATAVEQAEAKKAQALINAAQQYAKGTAEYAQLEEAAQTEYEQSMQAAQQTLIENMSLLWRGIAKALDPETAGFIDEAMGKQELSNKLAKIFGGMQDALENPEIDLSDTASLQEYVASMFEGLGMTDSDWATIAEQLDMDPAALQTALSEMIIENLQGAAFSGGNLISLVDMLQLGDFLSFDMNSLAGISEKIAPVMQAAIDAGLLEGVEGIDLTDPLQLVSFLMSDFGEYTSATIGKELTEGIDGAEANGTPTVTVNDPEVDTSGVPDEVASATQEAVDSAPPAETTQQVDATVETTVTSTDDSGIEDAVNAELAAQTMTVGVNAAVSLNVTVSDSNASTVGTAAGNQLGTGLVSGIASKASAASNAGTIVALSGAAGARGAYGQMQAAGAYAGQGFQAGLASKRTAILATARGIANSVAATIRMALDINSPSRVMMQLGQYTGEGFEVGAVRSFQHAMRTINRTVGELNLAPRTAAPDLAGALSAAASGAYSAEASRPINLYVNGRKLGQVLSRDTAAASNAYNRSEAMGVGK